MSDADREQAAETLRQAAGDGRITFEELDERLGLTYAARTYADLDAVTGDLPGPGVPARLPAPAAAPLPDRIGGTPGPAFSLAIMSGEKRAGQWVLPPRYSAVSIMGGVELDLRQARFSEPEVTISAFALMGGIAIIVPEDIGLEVSGFGFMGGVDRPEDSPGAPGAPRLRVTAFALMGGIEIKRKPAAQPGPLPLPEQERRGIEGY